MCKACNASPHICSAPPHARYKMHRATHVLANTVAYSAGKMCCAAHEQREPSVSRRLDSHQCVCCLPRLRCCSQREERQSVALKGYVEDVQLRFRQVFFFSFLFFLVCRRWVGLGVRSDGIARFGACSTSNESRGGTLLVKPMANTPSAAYTIVAPHRRVLCVTGENRSEVSEPHCQAKAEDVQRCLASNQGRPLDCNTLVDDFLACSQSAYQVRPDSPVIVCPLHSSPQSKLYFVSFSRVYCHSTGKDLHHTKLYCASLSCMGWCPCITPSCTASHSRVWAGAHACGACRHTARLKTRTEWRVDHKLQI